MNKINTGVYRITHRVTGTHYIGSTSKSFRHRWNEHRRLLRSGCHHNAHLQHAWTKHGEDAFEWKVIERLSGDAMVLDREQYWIDRLGVEGDLYNIANNTSAPMKGRRHTGQTRRKLARPHGALINVNTGQHIPPGHNLSETCRLYGLQQSCIWNVLNGRIRQYKGWVDADKLPDLSNGKPYPAFVNTNTGEVIPEGQNLSQMCLANGLEIKNMSQVIHGEKLSHKGWRLLNGGRENRQNAGKDFPALRNVNTGQTIASGQNLSDVCRNLGLDVSTMWKVIRGKHLHHKGWVVDAKRK